MAPSKTWYEAPEDYPDLKPGHIYLMEVVNVKKHRKPPETDKDWYYLSFESLSKLLNTCPNIGWRVFLGLCRIAGLRRGEALACGWADVDWESRRLNVISPKTKRRRAVPIEPELHELLLEAFEDAGDGEEYVVSHAMVSRSSVRKRFESIIRRAGLIQWAGLFQVLRRNRETDWAQRYPQYVVSTWMGHDITVSSQFYLQVPKELYDDAAQLTPEKRRSSTPGDTPVKV